MSKPGGETAPADSGGHEPTAWQGEFATAYTDAAELLAATGLDAGAVQLTDPARRDFPLRVPQGYAARIRRNDRHDPLLRQVLPVAAEMRAAPGFTRDPVGDLGSMRRRGLLQKYHGRALLVVTGACGIHCRYCFRRNFPYAEASLTPGRIGEALDEIRADRSISEVILSGGDPLSVTDDRLRDLLERIGRIHHVRRIRFHTRLPVALPARIDDALCDVLSQSSCPTVFVIHCNHANEIDDGVTAALARLAAHTTMLLNQSVLLRGVNDSAEALIDLSTRLFESGVMPYYLHQLDRVTGAAHFAVADDEARRLVDEISARLPGYLVPKLVREIPGAPAKQLL